MTQNKFILPSINECQYVERSSFHPLTIEQYAKVERLCDVITKDKHSYFIYRGDDGLGNIYNADVKSELFAEHLFVVGDKGKMFLNIKSAGNNISAEHAGWLFDEIHQSINNISNNSSVQKRMTDFVLHNRRVADFFSNTSNRRMFIATLQGPKRWYVNDYYEMFLHTIERNSSHNVDSSMLSASLNINVARQFCRESKVILVGWLKERGFVKYCEINKRDDIIENLGLPSFNQGVFPEQSEICLKHGLLPHFIIGCYNEDKFIVNQHLLLEDANAESSFKELLSNGLYIDQQKFWQHLGQTKYKHGFHVLYNPNFTEYVTI